MKTLIQFVIFCALSLQLNESIAQQGALPAGGDAQGATGSLAYSLGQVLYTTIEGEAGSASLGLQQPNLSATVATNEPQELTGIRVYPNPTNESLFLEVTDQSTSEIDQLSFQLFDVNGKLMLQDQLFPESTSILMNQFNDGAYLLRIYNNEQKSISYKIIKTR